MKSPFPKRPRVLALILAGGQGGRLDVLTERRAKPAVAFGGTYRLIDFALTNCMHSGLSDVWVVEQYRPHDLNEHLANGRPWDLDRTVGGLQVLPPYQTRGGENDAEAGFAEGNADALFQQRDFLRSWNPDVLLVLSADHVYRLDFRDVLDAHFATDGAEVTLVTTQVPRGEANRFGVVQTTKHGGRVTAFDYKPDDPPADPGADDDTLATVTAEVFVYDAPVLLDTLDALAAEKGDESGDKKGEASSGLRDFGNELLPRLVARGHAHAFALDGYWRDVGTVESYWQAHQDLRGDPPRLVLDKPAWPLRSAVVPRAPARIFQTARVDDSLVSPGGVVRGNVSHSVLGPGVVIEAGAIVRDSVLGQNVVVAAGAVVDHAILDENARVGAGATVGRKTGRTSAVPVTADNLVVIGQNVVVPARACRAPGSRTPSA